MRARAPSSAAPRSSGSAARQRTAPATRGSPRARRGASPTGAAPFPRARGSGRRRRDGAAPPIWARVRPRAPPRRDRPPRNARATRRASSPPARSRPPCGGRPQRWTRSAPPLGFERRLRLGGDGGEGGRVVDRDVGEHLSVELDVRLAHAKEELVVGEPLFPRGRVDADDPKPAEHALLVLPVTVGVDVGLHDLLLRLPVGDPRLPAEPLRLGEELAALLARVDGSLDARHGSPLLPEQPLDLARVLRGDRLVARERALALGALLLEVVALHRMTAQQLAAAGHLEALLRCFVRLLLRHLLSPPVVLRLSSARAT